MRIGYQFLTSLGLVLLVSGLSFLFDGFAGYRFVALLLLATVSVISMLFDIWPVLAAATASALIWDFFFIPPTFTFTVQSPEDMLLLLLYFVVALVNAVLTFKIRDAEKKALDKEQKEQAIQLYNTLFSSLSHELKTPLATLIGSVDVLQEQKEKINAEAQAALLREMETAALRLSRQVENLLSMARLESGVIRAQRNWCDINECMHALLSRYPSQTHVIRYAHDEGLPLFCLDSGFLETIAGNLVHNAIQYTPAGTLITVEAKVVSEGLLLSVSDNGPGIPAAQHARIFEKFYRLPQTAVGGNGLGLSIVKGFAEAMGGTVAVSAHSPSGVTFAVRVPAETSTLNPLKNE